VCSFQDTGDNQLRILQDDQQPKITPEVTVTNTQNEEAAFEGERQEEEANMDLDGDDVEEELLKSLVDDDDDDDDDDDYDDDREDVGDEGDEEREESRLSGYCTEGGESAVDQDQTPTGLSFLSTNIHTLIIYRCC
jgi:hypothetical protein